MILQEPITIDKCETGASLKNKTTLLARQMVKEFLNLYNRNKIQPIKQDESVATYEPQITEKEMLIDLSQSKEDVLRHLRALYPWACPIIKINGRYVFVDKYEVFSAKTFENCTIGKVVARKNDCIIVKGSDFLIKVYK